MVGYPRSPALGDRGRLMTPLPMSGIFGRQFNTTYVIGSQALNLLEELPGRTYKEFLTGSNM